MHNIKVYQFKNELLKFLVTEVEELVLISSILIGFLEGLKCRGKVFGNYGVGGVGGGCVG